MVDVAPRQEAEDRGRVGADEARRRRRSKNIALALILFGLVVLFYVITVVKIGGNLAP